MRYLKRIRKGGREYLYLARPGRALKPLPAHLPENHPQFMAAYAAAWDEAERKISAPAAGTLSALCASWRASHEFRSLAPTTRANKAAIMARLEARVGHVQVRALEARHIRKDLAAQPPHAANNLLKVWRKLMAHAVEEEFRKDDPALVVKRVKTPKSKGFHTWTAAEIAKFKERHAAGSMARLALYLLLFLGRRRSEVVRLGRQHLDDGGIWIRQPKTEASEAERLWLPLHPDLAAEIRGAMGRLTFLESGIGQPFATGNSFGNWWKDRCKEAKLDHWGTHGGRKAVATFLAEAGASAHQIKSVTGHKTLAEVQRYTEAAERRRLAGAAMERLEIGNSDPAVSNSGEKSNEISAKS